MDTGFIGQQQLKDSIWKIFFMRERRKYFGKGMDSLVKLKCAVLQISTPRKNTETCSWHKHDTHLLFHFRVLRIMLRFPYLMLLLPCGPSIFLAVLMSYTVFH